jgi:hypothetical protein
MKEDDDGLMWSPCSGELGKRVKPEYIQALCRQCLDYPLAPTWDIDPSYHWAAKTKASRRAK